MKKRYILFISLLLTLLILLSIFFLMNNKSILSSDENDFVRNHPILYLAPDPAFGPIEFIDENGTYKGIAADYIEWISRNFNLNIKIVNFKDWNTILESIKNKEIDMLGAASTTPQREEYLLFSEPFVSIEGVIITRNSSEENLSEMDLTNKKVLVIEGYSLADYMENNHPQVDLIYVKDISIGLSEVSFGKADALLTDIGQASFYINKYNYTNLKIAGSLSFDYEMRFAFRNDYPELQSIFNKALQNMPDSKKKEIHDSWLFPLRSNTLDIKNYVYTAIVFAIILLVIFSFILQWNRSLKKKVDEQTAKLKKELDYKHTIEKELLSKNNEITLQNEEIKKLNSNLEDTVEKRTMLLNRTNIELEFSMNALKDKQAELTESNFKLSESLSSLKDTQVKLIESEKQASLGRLVTGISHEINTPLGNSITGISYIKKELYNFTKAYSGNDKELLIFLSELSSSSKLILNNLEIAASLINRFKQLSISTNINQIQKININEFLDATLINLYSNLANIHIKHQIIADKKYIIRSYPSLLEQVIISLFSNSLVHGFSSRDYGNIEIKLYEEDNFLCISFNDDGSGISRSDSLKIFDPFFTTKRGQGSIGLGLHIVYIIITQVFKGSIELIPSEIGACFLIRLNSKD